MSLYPYQPVFIIGAARSGTKILRDVIGCNQAFDIVPYDINFIWRIGNESCPHDELLPAQITPTIARRVISRVSAFRKDAPYLVEKTVSNCLRVSFVDALFPDAKYVFLIRDGRDVVESAYRQWVARPDWKYVWDKARSYPLFDAPGYAMAYAYALIRKRFSFGLGDIPTWGPRYESIEKDLKVKSVIEVCAIQWARSIDKAFSSMQKLTPDRYYIVRYEDFVHTPGFILAKLGKFLGTNLSHTSCENITTVNVGKGWNRLNSKQQELVYPCIENALKMAGYNK